jgi:hypothetical protein
MKTKKAKLLNFGTLKKIIVCDEELREILKKTSGYAGKLDVYKKYWFSNEFIEKNKDVIDWSTLCTCQPLSDKIINEYHLNIDFDRLISYQKVSQKIILKYKNSIDVDKLTKYQPMTEKFISKHHELLEMCWSNIVFYQELSLQFLLDHSRFFNVDDLEGGVINEDIIDQYKLLKKLS